MLYSKVTTVNNYLKFVFPKLTVQIDLSGVATITLRVLAYEVETLLRHTLRFVDCKHFINCNFKKMRNYAGFFRSSHIY